MQSQVTTDTAVEALQQLRRRRQIRAISLDLDDTLWPIWPTIAKAEAVLLRWLAEQAPVTAAHLGDTAKVRALRHEIVELRPDLRADLSGLRRESIRLALTRAGDDPALAEPAFDVFFAARQRVELFDDALPALEFLSQRWPVVALSNGNANVHVVGIGQHFRASLSASDAGMAKPDARFFHAAAAAAGVAPEHVLHIGDDAALDALGAMDAGMHAAWLNRGGVAWPHEGQEPHITVASLAQLCRGLADR
ncbi:hydrolase [Comamonas phosphati]|nr:hydrolase [Comamonas phosphati]